MTDLEKVFEATYNPMVHESGDITLSIHRTREGAEKAIEDHKAIQKKEYDDLYKNDPDMVPGKWDDFQYWEVIETELKD